MSVVPVPSRNARNARLAGAEAVAVFRRSLAERLAAVVRRDTDFADLAIEVGLVDRRWLEDPGAGPVSSATPIEVVERFLSRSVEQHPSTLGKLGLNALQLMAFERADDHDGAPQPVTVVFTDLEGFTAFTSEHGDEAAIALLADHHRAVGPVVRGRGGRLVKRLGDGLMLTFPSPEAAVLAALELVETSPDPLRLRAGVNHGDAVVTLDDVLGHVVNVAARVTETAEGGQVVVTEAVREAMEEASQLTFDAPHEATLKGITDPVTTYRTTHA